MITTPQKLFRLVILTVLISVSLFTAATPALAASAKETRRDAALLAALQPVTPDPLGGRLGLAVASARSGSQASADRGARTAQTSGSESARGADARKS